MGRQIAIAMNAEDEHEFWKYLHSTADISVFRSWPPSEEPVDSFVVDRGAHSFYWSKYFVSQPNKLNYDVDEFDKWFTSLMRWTRKNGVKIKHGFYDVWSLPGARKQIEAGS